MQKWKQITAIALSFPSTLILSAIFLKEGIERGILSKTLGVIIFLAIIIHTIIIMLIYAYRKKD